MERAANPKMPLILVVDDDPLIRLQLRLGLEGEGYQIAEACNGAEGLALYQQLQPSIVLLDAPMIRLTGLAIPHSCSTVSAVVTLSIGLATIIPRNGLHLEDLIRAADEALYQAKHQGRNQSWAQQPVQNSIWRLHSQFQPALSPTWTVKCNARMQQFLSGHPS